MIPSILKSLRPEDIAFLVTNFQYSKDNSYNFGRLFPAKQTATLNWHVAEGAVNRVVAADIVARGASIAVKGREGMGRISGDIPKIAVSRIMNEDDYYELQSLLHQYQGNAEAVNFINMWADDYKYCYDGVMSRLEWIAMRSISQGKLSLSTLNNLGVASETPVDYQLDSDQKMGVDTVYTGSSTSGKPFTKDIPEAIEAAKARGVDLTVMRMNRTTWARFIAQTEVINYCASWLANKTSTQATPSLADVNAYLTAHSDLYGGLQIEVVSSKTRFEAADGTQSTEYAFADNVIGFYGEGIQGNTLWVRPIDMDVADGAIKNMKEIMMFKRFAETDPVVEKTIAVANALPVWRQAPNCILMDVSATSWSIN